jgi:hypothetical protein
MTVVRDEGARGFHILEQEPVDKLKAMVTEVHIYILT